MAESAVFLSCTGTGQDIDLDSAIILALRMKYLGQGEEIIDLDFEDRPGHPRPRNCPPVKMHQGSIAFKDVVSLETTSVVALEQRYENHQRKKSLRVKLSRTTQRSSTVASQLLRGVRSTFKTDLSVTISGEQMAAKGGTGVTLALDLRNRTSEIVTKTETFYVQQTVEVPPRKSTHVRWIIYEHRMVVSWTVTLYLEGYIMVWVYWDGRRVWTLENICGLGNMIRNLEPVNTTHCKITVEGIIKSEGGMRSDVLTEDQDLQEAVTSV